MPLTSAKANDATIARPNSARMIVPPLDLDKLRKEESMRGISRA